MGASTSSVQKTSNPEDEKKLSTGAIVGIVAACVVVVIGAVVIWMRLRRTPYLRLDENSLKSTEMMGTCGGKEGKQCLIEVDPTGYRYGPEEDHYGIWTRTNSGCECKQ